MLYEVLKPIQIEEKELIIGSTIELDEKLAGPMVEDGTLKLAEVVAPKPELTPEEKIAQRRTAMYADMIVSFRQDIEGIEMSLERIAVNEAFWRRRFAQTTSEKGDHFKKAEESLRKLAEQAKESKLLLIETQNFIAFMDEVMKGEVKIDFAS